LLPQTALLPFRATVLQNVAVFGDCYRFSRRKRQQSVTVSGNYVAVSGNNVAVSGNATYM